MKRTTTLGWLASLGLSFLIFDCSSSDDNSANEDESQADAAPAADTSGLIDVAADTQLSLSLRGGLGPILEGQTITKAVLTVEDVELVSESGANVVLLNRSVTTDLIAFQNDLDQLAAERPMKADRYGELKFRLSGAWIETSDMNVYASEGIDKRQFGSADVGRLDISGVDSDGFVTVALPESGVHAEGKATLAMHLALAESLSARGPDAWELEPRVWATNASSFSSLDVRFDASAAALTQLARGYSVMLLDAGLRPVSTADLARSSPTSLTASFRYLAPFQGPFVAVLLPPSGVSLEAPVALSIDVGEGVRDEAHVDVIGVQQVARSADVAVMSVRTGSQAQVIEFGSNGAVIRQTQRPLGAIDDVAPGVRTSEPLRPGQSALPAAPAPALPGLPPPGHRPGGAAAGNPTPPDLYDFLRPRRSADAAAPPHDAGAPPLNPPPPPAPRPTTPPPAPPPPAPRPTTPPPAPSPPAPTTPKPPAPTPWPPPHDAGAPPPMRDAGAPPPVRDAGAPPVRDAGAPPPVRDAGAPPPRPLPVFDAGTRRPPSVRDAGLPPFPGPPPARDAGFPSFPGPPPARDAGPPRRRDAGLDPAADD